MQNENRKNDESNSAKKGLKISKLTLIEFDFHMQIVLG